MKVILLKDVKGKGKKDSVIDVSDGYANNFLIKNSLAVPLTKTSKSVLDKELMIKDNEEQKRIDEYNKIKNALENKTLEFKVKAGKEDKVFGSISSKQISDYIKELGYKVDKKCIKIDGQISTLGVTKVEIELHKKVSFSVNVKLVK